jgi:hypothetical protein
VNDALAAAGFAHDLERLIASFHLVILIDFREMGPTPKSEYDPAEGLSD